MSSSVKPKLNASVSVCAL